MTKDYRKDLLYPAVTKAVSEILKTSDFVAPVDLLLKMQRLTKEKYEDWRFGRVRYLERVCIGNLSKLNRILRILERHARDMGLKPSQTVYHKWGRGGKRIILRFSKSGARNLEAAYSRHYVAINRKPLTGPKVGAPGASSHERERSRDPEATTSAEVAET